MIRCIHSRILLTECASESLYSVQNIANIRIRLIFDSSNTLVYHLGTSADPNLGKLRPYKKMDVYSQCTESRSLSLPNSSSLSLSLTTMQYKNSPSSSRLASNEYHDRTLNVPFEYSVTRSSRLPLCIGSVSPIRQKSLGRGFTCCTEQVTSTCVCSLNPCWSDGNRDGNSAMFSGRTGK